ncbi:MAG: DnaD domain protein [Coprobacillus sp.]|nr:DnaD domain protein [Coprobacillus sp.]
MVIVSGQDYFSVRFGSLVADYDRETLVNLYQPIIGYEAVALYFSFMAEARNQEVFSLSTHENFWNRLKMNSQTFMDAREKLEGIGLLKTKLETTNGASIYHYELRAPVVPSQFFVDPYRSSLFESSLGKDEAERIKSLYYLSEGHDEGDDITSNFQEAFGIADIDSAMFDITTSHNKKMKSRRTRNIVSEFDVDLFFQFVKEKNGGYAYYQDALTRDELNRLVSLFTLNGIQEEQGAEIFLKIYDSEKPKGERVDFDTLLSQILLYHHDRVMYTPKEKSSGDKVSSTTELGEKINTCETLSPTDYLSRLQGYTTPADSDIKAINYISMKYGLANSVLNALIEFTLDRCNNILKFSYLDKVGASLKRQKCTCAKDAFEYLYNTTTKLPSPHTPSKKGEEEDDEISKEDWDALINSISHGKD